MNIQIPHRARPLLSDQLGLWIAILCLEATLVAAYFTVTPDRPTTQIRYLVYPFVWINAGLWAVSRTAPISGRRELRIIAGSVAFAYFLLMLYLPGNLAFDTAATSVEVRIEMYAPGWGPLVAVTSPWIRLFVLPFTAIGYGSLSYLLYVNIVDLTRGTLSGVLGLVTCVGCTVPVLVPIVGIMGGPATSLATTAYAWSYDMGTVFFLLAVGILLVSHQRGRRIDE
ncbi:MAG: DUF7546 family protein [Natronomonas sp.]